MVFAADRNKLGSCLCRNLCCRYLLVTADHLRFMFFFVCNNLVIEKCEGGKVYLSLYQGEFGTCYIREARWGGVRCNSWVQGYGWYRFLCQGLHTA